MLEEITKFSKSLTDDQKNAVEGMLGDSFRSFLSLIQSNTEEEVSDRLLLFKKEVSALPIETLLAIHGELTDEQRSILEDLL